MGVWLFKWMVENLREISMSFVFATRPWILLFIPMVGGAVVGLISHFLIGNEKYHGTAAIMQSVALTGGRLRYQKSPIKTIAAVLSIGTGASVGSADPSVQIGANIGSMVGQKLHVPEDRLRTLVASGAASAIAAAFNAPIAGVFFALEIILGEIGGNSLGMILISAVTSSVFIQAVSGSQPAFQIPSFSFSSIGELPLYLLLGLAAGPISALFVRLLYASQDFFSKLGVAKWVKPIIAGAAVGLAGLVIPQVMGVGYETIGQILNRADFPLWLLIAMVVAKVILTPISLGGGFYGGVFAPSLFIGASLGGAIGELGLLIFPGMGIESAAFAMVGMAAVLAGVVHAPLTAAILLFEMTGDYRIILPLLFAVAVSMLVSQRIQPDSVYAMGLARHGIRLDRGRDIEVLASLTVREVMETNPNVLLESITLREATAIFAAKRQHGLPVVSKEGSLVGVLTLQDIDKANESGMTRATVGEICTRKLVTATPDESLSEALHRMSSRDLGRLPVVESNNPNKLVGILRRADVIHAYSVALTQRTIQRHHQQTVRLDTLTPTYVEVSETSVQEGSNLVGRTLSEISFPQGSIIASIQRGADAFIPHGETRVQKGDVLVVVAERAAFDEIVRLCQPAEKFVD
jgi:CIC family chloride channel protein